ncbi:IS3 family transposase [Caballeronia sp. J97]|uniref:IS3 family transposase n=1 Tax=Caballeronia sp. J97 TaxID=2805429 RepID=UPI0039F03338
MGKYNEQTKLAAAKDYCEGHLSLRAVAKRHAVDFSSLRQWVAAYKAHGASGLRPKRKQCYSASFKLSVLARVQEDGLSYRQAAALFDIRRSDVIGNWERQYKEGGVKALSFGSSGCHNRKMKKSKPNARPAASGDAVRSREELLDELNYLRLENAYLKKLGRLGSSEQTASARERAQIVLELRQLYPLAGLLRASGLARSTFYYQQKVLQMSDKYAAVKASIQKIFEQHKGRYGYRRITMVLRKSGMLINHKTVRRLMGQMKIKSCLRGRKFRPFRGEVGRAAPNLLQRKFAAKRPNEKWATDVTEFNLSGRKLYLSPVLDLYNGEIVSYEMARRPLFDMVGAMLRKAFTRLKPKDRPVLHSDQGWQYRLSTYRHLLKQSAVTPSMSRRGNCLDNAAMESFFGTLKTEFYYAGEFRDLDDLEKGLKEYIHYYNHERIKLKLKGLSPVEYRVRFAPA